MWWYFFVLVELCKVIEPTLADKHCCHSIAFLSMSICLPSIIFRNKSTLLGVLRMLVSVPSLSRTQSAMASFTSSKGEGYSDGREYTAS